MKRKLLIGTLSTVMSLGFLSGCNAGNNQMNNPEGVNYSPVRFDQVDNDRGDYRNQGFNDNYRNNRNDMNNRGNTNRGNNNQRFDGPSPVRFDGDRNQTNDMMDRGGLIDGNDNNRNNPFFNNNDGERNDNVNIRRGRDNMRGNVRDNMTDNVRNR